MCTFLNHLNQWICLPDLFVPLLDALETMHLTPFCSHESWPWLPSRSCLCESGPEDLPDNEETCRLLLAHGRGSLASRIPRCFRQVSFLFCLDYINDNECIHLWSAYWCCFALGSRSSENCPVRAWQICSRLLRKHAIEVSQVIQATALAMRFRRAMACLWPLPLLDLNAPALGFKLHWWCTCFVHGKFSEPSLSKSSQAISSRSQLSFRGLETHLNPSTFFALMHHKHIWLRCFISPEKVVSALCKDVT